MQKLELLMSAIESFYAITQDLTPMPGAHWRVDALPARSALAAVADRVDADDSRVVAEVLGEILYECRGALEYAEVDAPASRLARRIVGAMMPIAPGVQNDELDLRSDEELHAP